MTRPPEPPGTAASRWAAALSEWAIPDEILRSAPESPWHFPPRLFIASERDSPVSASGRLALDALGNGGSVLDVGCGGGAAGLALVPPAERVIGVDLSPEMLANFAAAAGRLGVSAQAVAGSWPAVADTVEAADVVVCHHVAYNVAALAPFVMALTDHARHRVVVELTDRHPQASLNPLWGRFWGLSRPQEPTAQMFIDVVRELGQEPVVRRWERPAEKVAADAEDYVVFVRRRLCLTADRDAEVAAALAADPAPVVPMVTVGWDRTEPSRVSSTG